MNELEIKLHKASIKADLKGRIVKPAVSLSDAAFTYTPAIKTNLAETYRKALEQMGERTKERVAA